MHFQIFLKRDFGGCGVSPRIKALFLQLPGVLVAGGNCSLWRQLLHPFDERFYTPSLGSAWSNNWLMWRYKDKASLLSFRKNLQGHPSAKACCGMGGGFSCTCIRVHFLPLPDPASPNLLQILFLGHYPINFLHADLHPRVFFSGNSITDKTFGSPWLQITNQRLCKQLFSNDLRMKYMVQKGCNSLQVCSLAQEVP